MDDYKQFFGDLQRQLSLIAKQWSRLFQSLNKCAEVFSQMAQKQRTFDNAEIKFPQLADAKVRIESVLNKSKLYLFNFANLFNSQLNNLVQNNFKECSQIIDKAQMSFKFKMKIDKNQKFQFLGKSIDKICFFGFKDALSQL